MSDIKDKSIICPECGQIVVLDKLKKHIKREHGFQEPFSLSQAIFILSKGNISASDLYSEINLKSTTNEHGHLAGSEQQQRTIPVASGDSLHTKTVNSNDQLVKARLTRQPNRLEYCDICGALVRKDRIKRHKAKVHKIYLNIPKTKLKSDAFRLKQESKLEQEQKEKVKRRKNKSKGSHSSTISSIYSSKSRSFWPY